jgi:putative hemolysin
VVQIGITSIGVLNGIIGESAFSAPLAHWLESSFALQARVSDIVATVIVVVAITFLTIIFGELVPKRIGQMYPESVATLVARPMEWLSTIARPFVRLLAFCTQGVLSLLGLRDAQARQVTEEEIAASLEEGVDAGVIEAQEHQMVRNVFRLDDRPISSMMVPRGDIAWLDADDTPQVAIQVMKAHEFARYPVCRGGLDDVVGVASTSTLLSQVLAGHPMSLLDGLEPAVYVPETLSGMELLDMFRRDNHDMVLVVDEYGEVQGAITLQDLLEAIAGEFSTESADDAWVVEREDGSWLMDGLIPLHELKDRLDLKELPEEDKGRYNTLAGMIMLLLGRLPRTTDAVEWLGWRFEVVDLDGKRVDKVLVTRFGGAES